ncbi:MAG: hypothetical protein AAF349_04785 [Cyanobacteria bacterium P01_A01_bin.68]
MKIPQWILEHSESDRDGWLEFCKICGYPVFYSLSYYDNGEGDWVEYWQPVNPVEGNSFLDEINNCPTCDSQLVEENNDDERDCIPATCDGCSNYHGQFYNGNLLVCAIHPHGFDDKTCPDFTR